MTAHLPEHDETPAVIGLHDAALALGVTVDSLRKDLQRDPALRELFRLVGRSLVAPSSVLPILVDKLAPKPIS
jgi:hypothetical protein